MDDQPDATIIDMTRYANQELDSQFLDMFNDIQTMQAVPLIFRDHCLPRLKNLLWAYHGRAGLQIVGDAGQVDLADLKVLFSPNDPVLFLGQDSLSCSS
jgi:hypothetical protein